MNKKLGLEMGILMGTALSFFLSLFGTLHSGHFSVPAFLVSFLVSLIVSIVISLLVPMPKLEGALCGKLHVNPRSLKANAVTALLSDLIYTTVITLAATALAYPKMVKAGGSAPFGAMFLSSLLPSLLIGYVLIFIFKPLFLKFVLKHNGIDIGREPPKEGNGEV